MADSKISDLSAATLPLGGTELLPVVQGGVSKKATVADLVGVATAPLATITLTIPTAVGLTTGSAFKVQGFLLVCQKNAVIKGLVVKIKPTIGQTYRFSLWTISGQTLGTEVAGVDYVAPATDSSYVEVSSDAVSWSVTAGTTYFLGLSSATDFYMGYATYQPGSIPIDDVGMIADPGGLIISASAITPGLVTNDPAAVTSFKFWSRITASSAGVISHQVKHDTVGGFDYIGTAAVGAATSATGWAVTRVSLVSPPVVTHSTGVWDSHTSLTYA